MKLCHVYKKQFRFYTSGILLFSLLVFPISFLGAETLVDELNQKITDRNNDINRLEKEIKQFQSQLNNLAKEKDSLSRSIAELDLNRKKLIADIAITENKIEKTNLKIRELTSQIGTKEISISKANEAVISGIKEISELESQNLVEMILSGEDFNTVWNEVDNILQIRENIRSNIVKLKDVKGMLEDTRDETSKARNELVSLKSQLADQKKIVDQNTLEKKKLLTATKNNESNYQKLLKDRIAKKDAFEKEIRDYESQIKFALDSSKLPNANVLSWPLSYIYITQYFGKTEAGKRLYANGTHNGVDFRAAVGTPVMAMSDGYVAGFGDTDLQCAGVSFGKFILIKYDNGLASTYGHLSLIKVSMGQKVSRGQIVGYSGNTGYSTGPHLHLSLYAKDAVELKTLPSKSCPGKVLTQPISAVNAYLDPMYYLPRK